MLATTRLSVILSLFLIVNCSNPYQVTSSKKWNLAAIYNPVSSRLHPSYKVYHNSDLTSLLYIKLFPTELIFNQANAEGEFQSKVSVQVQTYEINDSKPTLADSITYFYIIKQENAGKRFLTQIPLKMESGKRYQVRIVARDLIRKDFNLKFIDVDKTNEFSDQSFNILNQSGIPYFNNVVNSGEVFKIQHRNLSFDKIFVYYYKPVSEFPKPLFALSSDEVLFNQPDSLYEIEFSPNMYIGFTHEGFYRFKFDTNQANGLNILYVNENFPKVASVQDMIDPLAYITTIAEYKKLQANNDTKLTIDNYWLSVGGNASRARELIRIFYNRVYFANYYFTTNKPGWKTDKGMVFIMYGPPHNMQKTPNSETWNYYKPGAESSINFTFLYKPSPFSNDNFTLERSENDDWHWREAFDSWRAGEIYLSE